MNWDLYVDESGSFDEKKHCLVGGFIIPEGKISRELVLQWKDEIVAIPEIQDLMQELKWKYDHCMRNTYSTKRKNRLRGDLQYRIMQEYKKRFVGIGGKLVIFDNASGIYNIDNTTNFLTVLAKGLMTLYYDWPEKDPGIRLHFASRKNMTYDKEPDALEISPTRVMEPGEDDSIVILASQYIAQIRNVAFLQAGQQLLENENFITMLDNLDIIQDDIGLNDEGEEERFPNPLTVPSDYICNTYIKADSYDDEYIHKIEELYRQPDVMIYHTDRPLTHAPNKLPQWGKDGDNAAILLRLISDNFAEPLAAQFMRSFNDTPVNIQQGIIRQVIDSLKPKVESQTMMEELAERLGSTIDAAEQMTNEQIRLEFIGNLLLYQESLYTHLGNQEKVESLRKQLTKTIDKIEDDTVAEELMDIADNRRIVNLTDKFDYEQAREEFENMERYWKQLSEVKQGRRPTAESAPRYPVFGRTIGSYLQVLRHEIHQAAPEDKELYYSEAQDRFEQARHHLIQWGDVSRFHQNACDIEMEMGHFEVAFDHLYKAAVTFNGQSDDISETAISRAKADEILRISGYGGELYPFLLQHYVRLLSMMFMTDPKSEKGEILLEPMISHIQNGIGEGIRSIHPRTQIQWKTASFIAFRNASNMRQRKVAADLFGKATDALTAGRQAVFAAIAVGILAEQTWHIEKGNIPGHSLETAERMKRLYQIYLVSQPSDKKDPFDKSFLSLKPEDMLRDKDKLLQISFAIGY